jgi:hypothetical protein
MAATASGWGIPSSSEMLGIMSIMNRIGLLLVLWIERHCPSTK